MRPLDIPILGMDDVSVFEFVIAANLLLFRIFRSTGILEVKIVDEQDGFLSLEGHKIFGTAEVLEYHRTQSLNNSQVSGSTGAIISTAKSANRSKSSAALQNGENCEKPFRLINEGNIFLEVDIQLQL